MEMMTSSVRCGGGATFFSFFFEPRWALSPETCLSGADGPENIAPKITETLKLLLIFCVQCVFHNIQNGGKSK